jgi:aldehyde:ferredoxin oxidoreductase
MLGAHAGISDDQIVAKLSERCNELGLDVISTGNILGFLMDVTEHGWLPERFHDELTLRWGDHRSMLELMEKIAHRRGAGDLLAEGLPALAHELGPRARAHAFHAKGMEYAAWNPKGVAPMGLSYLTSTRGACHLFGQAPGGQNVQAMFDSAGDCLLVRTLTDRGTLARLVSAVLGRRYDEGDLFRIGARIINLEKCFNWREGFQRRDDSRFPSGLTVHPVAPAQEPFTEAWLEASLNAYYRRRGWDTATSKPERRTLEGLGLAFAARELYES